MVRARLTIDLLCLDKPHLPLYNPNSTTQTGEIMDIRSYNRDAWNREVEGGKNPWSQPVDPEIIAKARQGEFSILLT
jgi:hypothetical protein